MAKKSESTRASEMFSLRLEPKQRAVIEKAAGVSDVPLAKFVRDAAVSRAVELLNSSGQRETQLRDLARRVVDHLFNVKPVKAEGELHVESGLWESRFEKFPDGPLRSVETGEWADGVLINQQIPAIKDALRVAFDSAGREFVRLILEQWDGWGKEGFEYEPLVNRNELLD
jgi:uncharacterized protein (DUF1778 family)